MTTRNTLSHALSGGPPPTPPALLKRGYRVVSRVASSTSSVVSKVVDERSGNDYIVKAMTLENLQTAKARLAAQQEVAILKSLSHPNVIGYRDSFLTDEGGLMGEQLVIVMEYATDGDLREKRVVAEEESRAVSWMHREEGGCGRRE